MITSIEWITNEIRNTRANIVVYPRNFVVYNPNIITNLSLGRKLRKIINRLLLSRTHIDKNVLMYINPLPFLTYMHRKSLKITVDLFLLFIYFLFYLSEYKFMLERLLQRNIGKRLKFKKNSNLLQRRRKITVAKTKRINRRKFKNSAANTRFRRLGIQFHRVDSRQFLLIHLFSGVWAIIN